MIAAWGTSLSAEARGKIAMALGIEQQVMFHEVKTLVEKGGGVMLASIAHGLFQSLHRKQLEIIFKAQTEGQGEQLVRAMKLAEQEAQEATTAEVDKAQDDDADDAPPKPAPAPEVAAQPAT